MASGMGQLWFQDTAVKANTFCREVNMLGLLWLIALILIVLWVLGMIFSFISGPFLHVLLVIGIIILIVWLVQRGTFRR